MGSIDLNISLPEESVDRLAELSKMMGGASKSHVINILIKTARLSKKSEVKSRPIAIVDGITGPVSVGMDFLGTVRLMLKGGEARLDHFPEDYKNMSKWNYGYSDAPIIGWADDYINLYPTEAFKRAKEFYDKLGTPNAIYNELRMAGYLAMTGEGGRATRKRTGPDGKQHRVLVLTHSALSEIKS